MQKRCANVLAVVPPVGKAFVPCFIMPLPPLGGSGFVFVSSIRASICDVLSVMSMVSDDGFELIRFWGQKVESEGPMTDGQRQGLTELDAVHQILTSSLPKIIEQAPTANLDWPLLGLIYWKSLRRLATRRTAAYQVGTRWRYLILFYLKRS